MMYKSSKQLFCAGAISGSFRTPRQPHSAILAQLKSCSVREVSHVEKRGDFPTWKTSRFTTCKTPGGVSHVENLRRLRRKSAFGDTLHIRMEVYVNLMFVRLKRLLYIAFPYVDRESIIYMSVELSRRIYTHSLLTTPVQPCKRPKAKGAALLLA